MRWLLLRTAWHGVAWSVCVVCIGRDCEPCKNPEPIQTQFGGGGEARIPQQESIGHIWRAVGFLELTV